MNQPQIPLLPASAPAALATAQWLGGHFDELRGAPADTIGAPTSVSSDST